MAIWQVNDKNETNENSQPGLVCATFSGWHWTEKNKRLREKKKKKEKEKVGDRERMNELYFTRVVE